MLHDDVGQRGFPQPGRATQQGHLQTREQKDDHSSPAWWNRLADGPVTRLGNKPEVGGTNWKSLP